jgi:hypothetical protein
MIKFWFDKYKHGRASHRIRAHIPCEELKSRGIESAIVNDISLVSENDIVIFSKDSSIENMRKVKNAGIKVGFDLCDNKFEEDGHAYYPYCKEVDFITVNSSTMQEVVKKETGRDSFYYIDSVDRKIAPPVISSNKTIKLVWYGGSSSNKYVGWQDVIKSLDDSKIPYQLTICVNSSEKLRNKLISKSRKQGRPIDFNKVLHVDWTWEEQQRLVEESDIVFLPILADGDDAIRRTKTKSHNRLVDGIAQGKWVVSNQLPSYMPLANFCWLGDAVEGIRYFIANKGQVEAKILKGQEWIKANASPKVAADQLMNVYNNVKGIK